MKKFLKIMSLTFVVLMMSFALVACGGDDTQQPQGMTEEEYKAKLEEIGTKMDSISADMENIITMLVFGDRDIDALNAYFKDLKAPFIEFANLEAPEKYQEAQEKFKIGCETAVEILTEAQDCFTMMANGDFDMAELEAKTDKLDELTNKLVAEFEAGFALLPESSKN